MYTSPALAGVSPGACESVGQVSLSPRPLFSALCQGQRATLWAVSRHLSAHQAPALPLPNTAHRPRTFALLVLTNRSVTVRTNNNAAAYACGCTLFPVLVSLYCIEPLLDSTHSCDCALKVAFVLACIVHGSAV